MSLIPLKSSLARSTPAADPTVFLSKAEPGRLLDALRRRAWIVVVLSLLGAVTLYLVAAGLPKTYRAAGSVFVNSQAPVVLAIQAVAPEETRDLEQLRSVEQGMSGSSLLMRVIEKNRLGEDPAFAPPGASQQTLLEKFSSRVQIELRRGTRIIDVQVEDTDPERARDLVKSLVAEFENWTNERQTGITRQAGEGLTSEEERQRVRMAASARTLQEFREAHPIPGLEGNGNADTLGTLSTQLAAATATRLKLEAESEAVVKFDAANPQSLAGLDTSERGSEVLAQVKAIQQKDADFGRAKERYLFKHPVYKEIASEISLMKSTLAETVRAAGQAIEQRYRVAKENETKLAAEVATARSRAVDVEGVREQFRALVRAAEADRTLHEAVALRLRETSLAAFVPASVVRWQNPPMLPERPHSPRKLVFAAVGTFGGFLAGFLLLAGLELGDRKVRDSAAAARAIGAPMIATLPHIANAGDGMVLLSDPSSAGAESFRRLRAVLAPPPDSSARTVLFASARAGEGKSFCALNYATSLALQGHRTLLLDADLRRPGLSRPYLDGTTPDSGLGGYLAGKIDPAQACFTTSLPNLYLLSSGPLREDAAELLAGTRFPALLEDAYRWFDRVVIDTPPILAVSDMLTLGRYADRTCLVVSNRGSDSRELQRAADLIRSAGGTLCGFIWNESSGGSADFPVGGPGVPVSRPSLASSPAAGVPTAQPPDSCGMVPKFA